MEEDLFVKSTGEFGMWQAITVTAAYFAKFLSGWQLFAFLIIASNTPFTCISRDTLKEDKVEKFTSVCEDNCSIYKYDRSIVEETITSEWNLVCDREWMLDFSQSIFMLGMLIGQPLFGFISDRYGRRKPNFLSLVISIIGTMGASFGSNYSTFSIFRFISGVGVGASVTISFVILVEASGNKYREVICNLCHVPLVLSEVSLAGIGYAIRHWRILHFVTSIPHVLLVVMYVFVPESPRWLLSVGKTEEAKKVMKSIVRRNKLDIKSDSIETVVKQLTEAAITNKEAKAKANFLNLLKTSALRKNLFHCCCIWFIIGISYYGMQEYLSELSHNIYKNIIILGLIQVPVPVIMIWCQKIYGRKKSTLFGTTASGVCFVLLPFVNEILWLRLLFASIGSLSSLSVFCTLYVYTSELFPTVIRNTAMGVTGTLSRVGAMAAPFIAAPSSGKWIPPLVFGVLCFVASISCLCLPETKGQSLSRNLENRETSKEINNAKDAAPTLEKF